MGIPERLVAVREKYGYTRKKLADELGKPYRTITKYETGEREPGHSYIVAISKKFGVSTDYILGVSESMEMKETKITPPYSGEALDLAKDYDTLDRFGKRAVRAVTNEEIARCADETRLLAETTPDLEPEPKVIPLYWSAPAAGIASPILGEDYDLYELTADDPQGAMFAVKVSGNSMEPYFLDGSTAFCNKDPLQEGDIGVFSVDGGGVIKQYYYDPVLKMTYLFSLNRKRADADLLITSTSGQTLTCLGRVITRKKFPLPGR